ncbi:unnamed protein product [Gongylonema pulchrum]|uniref:Transposase n=1 Tax=Gongylonema pulchrum TaxID=637853 RepID=A0A183DPH0_9BILA|nr:unnamed protein product [Gongylonema pulchrum]
MFNILKQTTAQRHECITQKVKSKDFSARQQYSEEPFAGLAQTKLLIREHQFVKRETAKTATRLGSARLVIVSAWEALCDL